MAVGDHGIECVQDPVAIRIGDDKSWKQFDRMAGVASDLTKNSMLLKKRNSDELTEQTNSRRFQSVPGSFQFQ